MGVRGWRDRMSAVAGIKKVKKVTKTTSKKDGGETVTETTTTMSRESTGNMGIESKVSSNTSSRKESKQEEFEAMFCHNCDECGKIIGIDSKDLSYKEKHWHEACFLCNKCRTSLVDKQFGSKADRIYCGPCYDAQFATRCDGCGDVFKAGMKKMEYKTRQWHEKCFTCCVCTNPIGTKSFIPKEHDIYCASCYEDKFATKCIKCSKVITSGGVTYR